MIRWTGFLQGRPLNHLAHSRHSQSRGAQPVLSSACHRDGDGEAVLALPLPFYIYIIKSVWLFWFFFHFFVFPGDTTGTLYLQVTIYGASKAALPPQSTNFLPSSPPLFLSFSFALRQCKKMPLIS
jgi:hypothetical protein